MPSILVSRSLRAHLVRGVFGILAIWAAARISEWSIWPTLPLLAIAVWMLRGCPACWLVGLLEAIANRIHAGETTRAGGGHHETDVR